MRYKVGQRPRGEPIGYMFRSAFRPYAFECACARMQGQLVVCAFIYVLERLVLAVNAVVDRCTFLRLQKTKMGRSDAVFRSWSALSYHGVVETVGEPPRLADFYKAAR